VLSGQLTVEATKGGQYFTPSDDRAVIVFQAGDRSQYRSVAEFQAALGAVKIAQAGSALAISGLNGAQPLRVVPGEGSDLAPASDWLIYSPYVKQRLGDKVVHIQVDKTDYTIEF
jgi:hypothetical protein